MRTLLVATSLAILVTVALAGAQPKAPTSDEALELHLAGGDFRPRAAVPASIPAWFAAPEVQTSPSGRRYLVAMTSIPLGAEERGRLADAGAELLDYLPVRGYRVRLSPGAESAVRRLPFVAWLGPLPAHFKVAPRLAAQATETSAADLPVRDTSVRVILAAGEPPDRVLDALAGVSAVATPAGKDGAWRITAGLPPGRFPSDLSTIAALPEVEAIEPVLPMRPTNQDAVWVHQSFVGPSPQETPIFNHGIFGCGQIVAIADTAQDYDSCYFRDTVGGAPPIASCSSPPCPVAAPAPGRRKDILYYNWSDGPLGEEDTCPTTITGSSGHGTHTSGSIAGDTTSYADCSAFSTPARNGGDGQAPGAKLIVQEMGDGLEYLNILGGTLWNLADIAYQSGARIHSNSWAGACYDELGECIPGCTMPYDSYARDADLAMWTYPDLLIVTAAGNAGLYCPAPIAVGTPAIAKGTLAVGMLGHGTGASAPSPYASSGPVEDGRLKPAVGAQGAATVSAASDANIHTNNCASCSLDGSSMSAPTAAGLAALAREYYTAGFLATGARNPGQGFTPSGALLKATLLDGAVALGVPAPGPDFESGFGRIQLNRTLTFTGSQFQLRVDDRREGLVGGGLVQHAYDVSAGTPLRATLVWSDYPAALNAATARVNELKLEVVDPTGTVWFQMVDAGTGLPRQTSNPADTHDTLNVEERLIFAAPTAGRWIVRVRGRNVPWGPQPFALVVTGALTDCTAPAAPLAPVLTKPADRQVLVSWNAVSGTAVYNVYRALGGCPGGPWVPVATTVAGTSFLDTTVSGGVTYSYHVMASSDAAGACESPRSPCSSVVPTGSCTLAPSFHGIKSAASAGIANCTVNLSWDPATPYCQGDVRYNVYRGTTSGFVPGPTNRIARCLIGTSWADSANLPSQQMRWYIVRAEDASNGNGGACRGGNEETNTFSLPAAADGPPSFGTWTDDAGDTGVAKFTTTSPWTVASTGGRSGPKVYTAASSGGVCADLTTPALTLADPGQGPQLFFWTKHDLDYDEFGEIFGAEGSVGQVEIATGPAFTNWTRVLLSPDYPNIIDFVYTVCSAVPPTKYFTGINLTYTTYSASLANWAGGDVKIRFHLVGDLLYTGGNWWVDDASVTHAMVPGACAATPTGPPPIPDGAAVPGSPLRASKSGSNVVVTWDASQCPPVAVDLYRGVIGSFAAFTAGHCNLPPTGTATVSLPNNVWFLVAATNGASTDGSHGRTLTGAELTYGGASIACPAITSHVTNNGCP